MQGSKVSAGNINLNEPRKLATLPKLTTTQIFPYPISLTNHSTFYISKVDKPDSDSLQREGEIIEGQA